ncbi:15-hydroxyprostaglandin dehydrogenase [NAD(+)]-like [Photinus pyralis]|uniref:15-hydroxyprostaglandin dehydrogenase [NAD(+)]-like n=1 Tax=Photinus pyralis TaxID=7054 RepID=UPI001266FF44|nr:15-hydroxyprostaglandin dehydrogenase [NAD(+)]-like [Photinus pyralis]
MVSVNETRGSKAVRLLTEEFGSGKVIWIRADVSDERELEEAFKVSTAHWGALDIVVNDAGVSDESNPVRVINVNAVGVMQGTILGFRYMSVAKGGRGGVVINVASIMGIEPSFMTPAYSGSKAFVIGVGRSFGNQLYCNHNKVRVMTICPALTDTDLVKDESILASRSNEFIPGLKEMSLLQFESLYKQTPDNVGKAVVAMLNEGDSGSVWVSENEEPPYQVEFPDRKTMKKSSLSTFFDHLFN